MYVVVSEMKVYDFIVLANSFEWDKSWTNKQTNLANHGCKFAEFIHEFLFSSSSQIKVLIIKCKSYM